MFEDRDWMKRIFIVGVGRSGTSLLQSMFAAHPMVAMLPETGFLRRYCGAIRGARVGPENVEVVRTSDTRLQRLPEGCWDTAVGATLSHSNKEIPFPITLYRELLKAAPWCESDHPTGQYVAVGDKDPRSIEFLPLLYAVFPDSYVIHIVRDPRDVVLSKMNAEWSRTRRWWLNVFASRLQFDAGEYWGRRLFGDHYLRIRYEDLIHSPETVLQTLTRSCDIPFDPEMLEFSGAAARLGGGKTEEWKQTTLGPLLSKNSNKWREGLTSYQIAVTEGACTPWFSRFDYLRSSDRRFVRGVYQLLFIGLSPLYRLFRSTALFLARKRLER